MGYPKAYSWDHCFSQCRFVNSIASSLRCQYKIFADDLKIYACVKRTRLSEAPVISHQCVQDGVTKLHDTTLSWGLHMNVTSVQSSVFLEAMTPQHIT